MINMQHNNRNIYFIWWPIYAVLLVVLVLAGMIYRIVEAMMTFMEIEE